MKSRLVRFSVAAALLIIITIGGALTAVMISRPDNQRNTLWLEMGKGLIQLFIQVLVIGILGTLVKLITDRYQDERLAAEQRRAFRQDKYDRLVDTTNALRKVPILIEANRSVKTWSEQMIAAIDAGLELRIIKH